MLDSCGLALPIPHFIDSVCLGGQTYIVMARISGNSLLSEIQEGHPTDEDLRAIVDEIHAVLRQLWTFEQPARDANKVVLSASGHGLPDPLDHLAAAPGRSCTALAIPSSMDFRAKEPELIRTVTADRIICANIDLKPYYILEKDGALSGIIDWGRPGWLPRHWQLHALRNWAFTNPPQPRRMWNETKFPEVTEAAFQASLKLVRYPISA
ncbi:hypothetical protein EW146_g10513 [Bondarzewia mesenterica]|uniref:Aminoglycoside phosphotransferase domain-containing protein n=1 Tax=Bondarzewia mesenterica TaxID=1095465 RepID=A0A4S4KW62_9AGAM|nr:hypothetical protein EW146_g10513 [Bondarzewia mesenterica]